MMGPIGDASVLGFIPTAYPAGVILAERWDYNRNTMQRFSAWIDDIDRADGFYGVVVARDLAEARRDFIGRATKGDSNV